MMERTQIFDLMGELKLFGMRSAYDEVMTSGIKRQHEPPQIVGSLLKAEIDEKHARSIKYQMTIAKLPLAKDIDDFVFDGATVNEALVRDLASGDFVSQQRNIVLVGGTGTGKTHLAIAIARSCIRASLRGRFFNTVDCQSPRGGDPRRAPGTYGGLSHTHGFCCSRRTWLSALRSGRRAITLPPHQPPL
jgi:DNA replication protein DnaC